MPSVYTPKPKLPNYRDAHQRLLGTARRFAKPFTLDELAIAAWLDRPLLFGIRGYEAQYPDTARVRACLWSSFGLIYRRQIVKIACGESKGLYQANPK